MINENTLPGTALLVLAGAVTLLSLDMGTGAATGTLKPNFFPLICAAGLALCGAALIVLGLVTESGGKIPSILDWRIGIITVLLVLYFWWFEAIDFRLGAWVFAVVSMLAFGIRSPALLLVYPVMLTTVLYFGFTQGFGVVLPTWN